MYKNSGFWQLHGLNPAADTSPSLSWRSQTSEPTADFQQNIKEDVFNECITVFQRPGYRVQCSTSSNTVVPDVIIHSYTEETALHEAFVSMATCAEVNHTLSLFSEVNACLVCLKCFWWVNTLFNWRLAELKGQSVTNFEHSHSQSWIKNCVCCLILLKWGI